MENNEQVLAKNAPGLFSVYAEAKGYDKPLIVLGLTFARLMDDIVVPYHANEPFFIDGAPLTRNDIQKLKILKQKEQLQGILSRFHLEMRRSSNVEMQRVWGEQYHTRVEAILRDLSEDVTTQVIKAFDRAIKPRLKDYLPKRDEVISAATTFFMEGMKLLNK